MQQQLSQINGVGDVDIGGSSLPAVRVELNPHGPVQLRHRPGGRARRPRLRQRQPAQGRDRRRGPPLQIYTNDQGRKAADYRALIVAYRNGAAVQLADVAQVLDGVEDMRNLGLVNGKPGVLLFVYKQPGANIIATVDAIKEALPQIAAGAAGRHRHQAHRSTAPPRSAPRCSADEETLLIAIILVVLVVFALPAHLAGHPDPRGGGADLAARHPRGDVPARLSASTTCR